MSKKYLFNAPGSGFTSKALARCLLAVALIFGLLSRTVPALAQDAGNVTGTVKDVNGLPLEGVIVKARGASVEAMTDSAGVFVIGISGTAPSLIISFLGMKTQEVPVNGRSVIQVVLEEDVIGLEDVVVVGYGSQKKGNLTGSVVSIESEDLTRAPVASTTNALAGRLPGLITKQGNGAPGEDGAVLRIRGFGAPLVIVDGVPQSIDKINPNEIESITVLKDAAAAIYGAQAGNGVILITTKRGKIGKPTITVRSSYTLQGVTTFAKKVNAGQYAELYREAQLNAGVAPDKTLYSEEDIRLYYDGTDPEGHPNTNWWEETMNDWAPMQEHTISVSGGSKAICYYGFLGYLNQAGMFKSGETRYNRYNARMNVDADITKNLSLSFDLSATIGDLQRPSRWGVGFWLDFFNAHPVRHSSFPDPTKVPFTGQGGFNPIANSTIEQGGYTKQSKNLMNGILSLKYDIPHLEGLSLKALANYRQNADENKAWVKQYDLWDYDYESDVYTRVRTSAITRLIQRFTKDETILGQFSLNYDRMVGEDHSLKGLLLYEVFDYKTHWLSGERRNYITGAIDYLFAGGNEDQIADGRAAETGRSSVVGRINYGYKDKYLAELTLRYDGSPKFPKDKRWGWFPSVSVGWRLSEEPFIKNKVSWISDLKLRASLSNTGVDATGAFQYLTGYQFAGQYVIGGAVQQGLNSTGLANSNIRWESMTTYNAGLDFSLLNGKIYSSLDVFYRLREDMLATRVQSLPSTFGASLPAENINSQSNRGFEAQLGYRNSNGNFKYDISGNLSWSRAKWEHFEEPEYTDPDQARVYRRTGTWTDLFYGYQSDGLFTSQEEIDNLPFDQDQKGNTSLHPGDIKYVDRNKDGVLDWKDISKIGHGSMPLMMAGLNFTASYKGFDASLLVQGATRFNFYLVQMDMHSPRTPSKTLWEGRWTPENNDPNARFPRQALNSLANKSIRSDFYLIDGSYARLKSVSLGYTFPASWIRPAGIERIRIYLAGMNLLTVSDTMEYDIDPEAVTAGNLNRQGNWFYPQQRTLAAGLEISL